MFDTCYLSLVADREIDFRNNCFSVDDSRSYSIRGGGTDIYKIKEGTHTITITSGTGAKWTFEEKIRYDQVLTILLGLSGGDICEVSTKIRRSAPMGFGLLAKKLY